MPRTAWAACRALGIPAGRIVQCLGAGRFSGGTHGRDGFFINEKFLPESYSCAFDISVLHPFPFTEAQIKSVLSSLARRGIAAWFRDPSRPEDGWHEAPHIHAVDCNLRMKPILQDQIHNWVHGLNGLVTHTPYHFYTWPVSEIQTVRTAFLSKNPSH